MAKKKKKAKKKAARRAAKRAPSMEMLLVGSKTKQALKNHGVNVAGDAVDSLNMVVHWYIDQAAKRAAANNRKTVRGHDFING
ncbi:MAG: hypothetical protein KDC38_02480 [Planctomycetes bacterium]|nr:hypothetical protein [Planctomycetota bacterium]